LPVLSCHSSVIAVSQILLDCFAHQFFMAVAAGMIVALLELAYSGQIGGFQILLMSGCLISLPAAT
jgi:hypothetical protein